MLPWADGLLLAAMICLTPVACASTSAAQWAETKVQEPWAYTHRIDETNSAEFMATTPALEDPHIWLLLACKNEQAYASVIHSEKFPYALRERARLILQFDQSEPVMLSVAVVRQKQIVADPQPLRELIPVLIHSNKLSASITEINGTVHVYSFLLQPNDQALREIDVHCFQSAP
jgi:hypothetical protein